MIEIRPATNEDGPAIEALLMAENSHVSGVDWSDLDPFWAVAELDGEAVGCVQVVGSRPIGFVGFLVVRKDARKHSVAFSLCEYALAQLRAMGVLAVMFFVGHDKDMDSWRDVLKRAHSIEFNPSGTLYARSTAPVMAFAKRKAVMR